MSANHDIESTLTDRYQTTVPETVRRALRLGKRDKIPLRRSPEWRSGHDARRRFCRQ